MTRADLLNKMQEQLCLKKVDREKAAQILETVEGMSIWAARELLECCIGALQLLDISYREPRDDTTP